MFTWNFGPCARRLRPSERIPLSHLTDDELSCLYDTLDFIDKYMGGHRLIFQHLNAWSHLWLPGKPIEILILYCGRGETARALVRWAKKMNVSMHVLAVDPDPRLIKLAKEKCGTDKEITFDVKDASDALFFQARSFDYVIGLNLLNRCSDEEAVPLLRSTQLMSKRGFIVVDWIRDLRAYGWMRGFSSLMLDGTVRNYLPVLIRRGFVIREVNAIAAQANLEYVKGRKHFGFRFSLAGERGLVMDPKLSPIPRLAGI